MKKYYKIVDKFGEIIDDRYDSLVEAEYMANVFNQLFGDGFEIKEFLD